MKAIFELRATKSWPRLAPTLWANGGCGLGTSPLQLACSRVRLSYKAPPEPSCRPGQIALVR